MKWNNHDFSSIKSFIASKTCKRSECGGAVGQGEWVGLKIILEPSTSVIIYLFLGQKLRKTLEFELYPVNTYQQNTGANISVWERECI